MYLLTISRTNEKYDPTYRKSKRQELYFTANNGYVYFVFFRVHFHSDATYNRT